MENEYRDLPIKDFQYRESEDGSMSVEGYAIVYNQEITLFDDYRETILPGASTEALQDEDIYYLWQHDTSKPLARKKIGTLTAKEDTKGVYIKATFPATQFGRDCYADIKSGLVDKHSFAFRVKEDQCTKTTRNGIGYWLRTIVKFQKILEFSPVTFPAYDTTTLEAKSKQLAGRNKPNNQVVLQVLKDARDNNKKLSEVMNGLR